jgi:hypothetical protein
MQSIYSFGIHDFEGSLNDIFVVDNYFKVDEKVPYGPVIIE